MSETDLIIVGISLLAVGSVCWRIGWQQGRSSARRHWRDSR